MTAEDADTLEAFAPSPPVPDLPAAQADSAPPRPPSPTRASLVRPEDIYTFWDCVFRYGGDTPTKDGVLGEGIIEVRKIGRRDGELFQESITAQPWLNADEDPDGPDAPALRFLLSRVRHAADSGVGAFICPGVLNAPRASDESVTHLLAVTVDLDSGDTTGNLMKLVQLIGKPTLIVASGGTTKEGKPKLHVHYRLKEPCDEPQKVAHVRDVLAQKAGGDSSFKRIPQVIRIPGSVYDKDPANPKQVRIIEANPELEYNLEHFMEVLDVDFQAVQHGQAGAAQFKDPAAQAERFKQIATTTIAAGGTDDTRFGRFSEYAGHMIQLARVGKMTSEEALRATLYWADTQMDPPWPEDRAMSEFSAIMNLDRVNHAAAWAEAERPPLQVAIEQPLDLDACEIGKLFPGRAPPIPFIVQNFLVENSVHVLVADGGVGKTYMLLDMALKLAIGPNAKRFLTFEILKPCVTVVLTVEDTKDDIHRRLDMIDYTGQLRARTEGRMYVVPVKTVMRGGLALVEKDRQGNHQASKRWEDLVRKLKDLKAKHAGLPMVVMIDTYSATHHGDENSSVGTNEWFKAASLLETDCQAAVMVTHHVRKESGSEKEPITTTALFKHTIRGSSAFIANPRAVYGLWEMPNQKELVKAAAKELGGEEEVGTLINFGLVKNNIGLDWSDQSAPRFKDPLLTLRRTGSGLLLFDETIHRVRLTLGDKVKEKHAAAQDQLKAAVVAAIQIWAAHGYPLVGRNLTREHKDYLPKEVHNVAPARETIEDAIREALAARKIVRVSVKVRGKTTEAYDVPTGDYALGTNKEKIDTMPTIDWSDYAYDAAQKAYIKANK